MFNIIKVQKFDNCLKIRKIGMNNDRDLQTPPLVDICAPNFISRQRRSGLPRAESREVHKTALDFFMVRSSLRVL